VTTDNPRSRAPWLARLVVESVLIVLSILLALGVDSWREERHNTRLAEQALASFEAEIRENKAAVEAIIPYHRRLQKEFAALSTAGEIRKFEDLRKVKDFKGLNPTFVRDTAWRTAVATGSLEHLDYETVQALSYLYTLQERVVTASNPVYLFGPTSLADENIPALARGIVFYLGDVTSGDQSLQKAYGEVLSLLEKRPGRER
jgi:hypothetical protein